MSFDYNSQLSRFTVHEHEMRGYLTGCITSFIEGFDHLTSPIDVDPLFFICHDSFVKALSNAYTMNSFCAVSEVRPSELFSLFDTLLTSPTPETDCLKWLNSYLDNYYACHRPIPLLLAGEVNIHQAEIAKNMPPSAITTESLIRGIQHKLDSQFTDKKISKIRKKLHKALTDPSDVMIANISGKEDPNSYIRRIVEKHIAYSIVDNYPHCLEEELSQRVTRTELPDNSETMDSIQLALDTVDQVCDQALNITPSSWDVTENCFDYWLSGTDRSNRAVINDFIRGCYFSLIQTGFDLAKGSEESPADLFVKYMFRY